MKNILIIIDMQNGFLENEYTKNLTSQIEELLNTDAFDVVIGTRFLNAPNSIYEQLFDWKKLKNPCETSIPEILFKHMDYVEDKYIYNCVHASFLQRLCQLNDGQLPRKVYLAGVDTDCCVLTTATSLFENNIRPIVLTKYCASNGGPQSHEAGILCLKRLIGEKQLFHKSITSRQDLI